jgi:hypothetical protein
VVDAFDYVSNKEGILGKYMEIDYEVEGRKVHTKISGRCREQLVDIEEEDN